MRIRILFSQIPNVVPRIRIRIHVKIRWIRNAGIFIYIFIYNFVIGDLLHRLKIDGGTEEYIEQLIPTSTPISKVYILIANW